MEITISCSTFRENDTITLGEHRKGPSECEVCYRPAHGHHCGVASCKGCKTFFRRMCVSNIEVECKFEEDCFDSSEINQIRLRCQACRYKKCIKVGMDPSTLELKEGEDKALNYKNLLKRQSAKEDNEHEKVVIRMLESKESQSKRMIEMLIYLDLKIEQFRSSAYNPQITEYRKSLEEVVNCNSKISLADKLGQIDHWPLRKVCDLPKISRIRSMPDTPPIKLKPKLPHEKMWLFFNMLTTIEYAKTFMFFHKLDLKDRIVLAGHATLTCMNLHTSYFAVSKKVEGCLQPDGSQNPMNDEYHYPILAMSITSLIRCNVQKIEYVLLKAICLCNPTVHDLSEHAQKIIEKERQQFADVLLEYCLKNRKNGPSRYVELLGILTVLESQQRFQKDIHIYHVAPLSAKFNFCLKFPREIMNSQ